MRKSNKTPREPTDLVTSRKSRARKARVTSWEVTTESCDCGHRKAGVETVTSLGAVEGSDLTIEIAELDPGLAFCLSNECSVLDWPEVRALRDCLTALIKTRGRTGAR